MAILERYAARYAGFAPGQGGRLIPELTGLTLSSMRDAQVSIGEVSTLWQPVGAKVTRNEWHRADHEPSEPDGPDLDHLAKVMMKNSGSCVLTAFC
jgi:hypothetical protein